jgi:hypothetical protein
LSKIKREQIRLERAIMGSEQKLAGLIKKGDLASVQIATKSLARQHKAKHRFEVMETNIDSLSNQMAISRAMQDMVGVVRIAGAAMRRMNEDMKASQVGTAMRDFSREAGKLDDFQADLDVRGPRANHPLACTAFLSHV